MSKRNKLLLVLIFLILFPSFSAMANELFFAFVSFSDSLPTTYEEILRKLPTNIQNDLDALYNIMDRITAHQFDNEAKTDSIRILLRTNYLKVNIIQRGYGNIVIAENNTFFDFYNYHKSRALEMHMNVINALVDLARRDNSFIEYLNMFTNLLSDLEEYL